MLNQKASRTRLYFCTVVEGADRLEALSDTERNAEQEHDDAGYDAHGRDGCIAIRSGHRV